MPVGVGFRDSRRGDDGGKDCRPGGRMVIGSRIIGEIESSAPGRRAGG